MNRRSLLLMGAAALALTAAGCAPPWQVILEAVPDPFINQRRFAVLPVDFTGLRVGDVSEGEFLTSKDPDQVRSFAGDKQGINAEFTRALIESAHNEGLDVIMATGPTAAPYFIRPSIAFVEPGYEAVVFRKESVVDMTFRITTPDGRVLDEVKIRGTTQGMKRRIGVDLFSSGGRLRACATRLGLITAAYLKKRVEP